MNDSLLFFLLFLDSCFRHNEGQWRRRGLVGVVNLRLSASRASMERAVNIKILPGRASASGIVVGWSVSPTATRRPPAVAAAAAAERERESL
jgi:hypothetical protein